MDSGGINNGGLDLREASEDHPGTPLVIKLTYFWATPGGA